MPQETRLAARAGHPEAEPRARWTSHELEVQLAEFRRRWDSPSECPDRKLTLALWKHWLAVGGTESLFGEAGYDLALVTAAQAYGEPVPKAGGESFIGKLRHQHRGLEGPFEYPRPAWGPSATLSPVPGPVPHSDLVQVFVYWDAGRVREVLVAGKGIPGIRSWLFRTAFSCVLRMGVGDLDMLGSGLFRIMMPAEGREALELPGISTLRDQSLLKSPPGKTAEEALLELVRDLKAMASDSGLIAVRDREFDPKQEFDRSLRRYSRESRREEAALALALDPARTPAQERFATVAPIYTLGPSPDPVCIPLPPDLLHTPAFESLLERFTLETLDQIQADAEARKLSYTKKKKQLESELQRWKEAGESLRKSLWGKTVTLTVSLEPETGIEIKLRRPKQVDTSEWMEERVPGLISTYGIWADRMQKVVGDMLAARRGSDIPVKRLATGIFLDAALRNDSLDWMAPGLRTLFHSWSRQAAPYLRMNWRRALRDAKIEESRIFTAHTVFHTRFAIKDDRLDSLIVQPFLLISPVHAVIVFDPAAKVMQVRTPSESAKPAESGTGPGAEEFMRSWMGRDMPSGHAPEESWQELREALLANPRPLLGRLAEAILPEPESGWEGVCRGPLWTKACLEVEETIRLAAIPDQLLSLLEYQASSSALRLAGKSPVPANREAGRLMWEALAVCLANGRPPKEVIRISGGEMDQETGPHQESVVARIDRLITRARKLDPKALETWVSLIHDSKDLGPAIHWLRSGWAKLDDTFADPIPSAWSAAVTVANLLAAARALDSALATVQPEGETRATLFGKIGMTLADLLLLETGMTPQSDIADLMELLLATERKGS